MMFLSWLPRRLAVSAAVVALVAVAAAMALGLAYPEPVSSNALGPEWQCSRLALVFTTCTRVATRKTAAVAETRVPACPRSIAWRNALGLLR